MARNQIHQLTDDERDAFMERAWARIREREAIDDRIRLEQERRRVEPTLAEKLANLVRTRIGFGR